MAFLLSLNRPEVGLSIYLYVAQDLFQNLSCSDIIAFHMSNNWISPLILYFSLFLTCLMFYLFSAGRINVIELQEVHMYKNNIRTCKESWLHGDIQHHICMYTVSVVWDGKSVHCTPRNTQNAFSNTLWSTLNIMLIFNVDLSHVEVKVSEMISECRVDFSRLLMLTWAM